MLDLVSLAAEDFGNGPATGLRAARGRRKVLARVVSGMGVKHNGVTAVCGVVCHATSWGNWIITGFDDATR